MKKQWKYTLAAMVAVFAGLQLVPVARTNPPVAADLQAPPAVKEILKASCYDCHSNETRWPWYSRVAPVSWLVAHDVKEGREELNFSAWGRHADDPEMAAEIVEEVAEGEMPPRIYLVTHPGAAVDATALAVLRGWAGLPAGGHHAEGDDD